MGWITEPENTVSWLSCVLLVYTNLIVDSTLSRWHAESQEIPDASRGILPPHSAGQNISASNIGGTVSVGSATYCNQSGLIELIVVHIFHLVDPSLGDDDHVALRAPKLISLVRMLRQGEFDNQDIQRSDCSTSLRPLRSQKAALLM